MDEDHNSDPFDDAEKDSNWNNIPIIGEHPSNVPLDEGASLWKIIRGCLVAVGITGFCLLLSAGVVFLLPNTPLVARFFPSPTTTFTPTNTSTPTNTPTSTPNMTAQAYEATAVYAADEWNENLSETFETNEYRWYVGTDDGEYAKITYAVKDGKYIWDTTAHQGFVQWVRVNDLSISDFYFSLEATQPGFTTAADYGIIFREDAFGNYYYFGINNKGLYSLWLYNKDEWTVLIESTKSSAILPRQANKAAVLAEGDHFIFFINDQYVTEIHDDTVAKGRVGMAVEVLEPDLNVIFEFDNIVLNRPK